MAREKEGYRETLAFILEAGKGKGWLSTTDIAKILGVSRSTVVRRFGITSGCAAPVLAMKLVRESK